MDSSNKYAIYGIILGLFILRDLYSTTSGYGTKSSAVSESADPDDSADSRGTEDYVSDLNYDLNSPEWKNGPGSKISSAKFIGPTLKFVFCASSGYQNAFDEFSKFIMEKYPELTVQGTNYPPPTMKKIGAQLIMVLKLLVVGSVVSSQYSFLHLLSVPTSITNWISQNKIFAALMTFFVANFLESQLVSTGAFEIFFDDVPVWSKLQTGRMPNPAEIVQIIDNQLKLGRGTILNDFDM